MSEEEKDRSGNADDPIKKAAQECYAKVCEQDNSPMLDPHDFIPIIREAVEANTEELERLRQWKRDGMRVLDEWESVWIEAGSPGIMGKTKAKAVLEFIKGKR